MATNCVCDLNNSGTSPLISSNARIASAAVDENGRLVLTNLDGSTVTSTISDCCCYSLASINYALSFLQNNTDIDNIVLNLPNYDISFTPFQATPVEPASTTVDITVGSVTNTVAIRKIKYITFYPKSFSDFLNNFTCDSLNTAPQCPSNLALESKLREFIGNASFPVVVGHSNFSLNVATAPPISLLFIAGICNGILWCSDHSSFYAIPFGNIASFSYE